MKECRGEIDAPSLSRPDLRITWGVKQQMPFFPDDMWIATDNRD